MSEDHVDMRDENASMIAEAKPSTAIMGLSSKSMGSNARFPQSCSNQIDSAHNLHRSNKQISAKASFKQISAKASFKQISAKASFENVSDVKRIRKAERIYDDDDDIEFVAPLSEVNTLFRIYYALLYILKCA